jgi:hypothetical protein
VKSLVGLFFILISLQAWSAPYPATSSSALTAPEKGLFTLNQGYTLKTEGTDWVPIANSEDSILNTIRYASKQSPAKGSLSVRIDKIAKNSSLDLYVRKWMRDYPNYGFEVLSSKNFKMNGNNALVVDMLSRAKGKQIRQVIVQNNDRLAIMTCLDDQNGFAQSVQQCNQIMKSFNWSSNSDSSDSLKK